MARSTSRTRGIAIPRFAQEEATGAGGSDSGDGGADALLAGGAITPFAAVYNDGGVAKPVSYIANVYGPLVASFAAAGFAVESGFIVNANGVAVPGASLLTSTSVTGPLPFGVSEYCDTLTKNGTSNVARYLVRLGP